MVLVDGVEECVLMGEFGDGAWRKGVGVFVLGRYRTLHHVVRVGEIQNTMDRDIGER